MKLAKKAPYLQNREGDFQMYSLDPNIKERLSVIMRRHKFNWETNIQQK